MLEEKKVPYQLLRKAIKLKDLSFTTTKQLPVSEEFFLQKRALKALHFGINIPHKGFNIYAMGPSGIGKRSFLRKALKNHVHASPVPSDWCYIHNFLTPEKPIALELPPGYGYVFQKDMKLFTQELQANLISVFESEEYRIQMQKILDHFNKKRAKIIDYHGQGAKTAKLYKAQHQKEDLVQLKFTKSVVKPLIKQLSAKYTKLNLMAIVKYLKSVQIDILHHVDEMIKFDDKTHLVTFVMSQAIRVKYQVNLLVDHRKLKHAPYVFEENPTYSNLICRIEYINQMGGHSTNFTLIKPGALHQANKGYLVIEANKIIKNKEAWEALKNALYAKKIKIKPEEDHSDYKPISLHPMPIPLDIKIILVGDRETYYKIWSNDPDFAELFKVVVDFDESVDWNKNNIKRYAAFINTVIHNEALKPFHVKAVAAIIEYSSRLAENNEKLSCYVQQIKDLIVEAAYWAELNKHKLVTQADVAEAIQAQIYRLDRSKQLYDELILKNFIIIKTSGKTIGQVNCLSIRSVGHYSYGHPTRVTARAHLGKGKIIDIQREIEMAGPIHSKAGLIIANFLMNRFHLKRNISISASVAFEQIYCWTDGDSASIGELCALLSALANIPILQCYAVTGSIDQYGQAQAVGGVNEKIEGYFDVCLKKGLTGQQGVLIPSVNIKNLMLREDVVKACKNKKFHIFAIDTIDEALAILTGIPAGIRQKNGMFPKGSVYFNIENRFKEYIK